LVQFADSLQQPFPFSRQSVMGANGAVATSQPLAAQAGMAMLQRGGNAIDAAIATAIALTVVEPTSNGIGADAFALVWADGALHGLNASGRAPELLTAAACAGYDQIPEHGWVPVTVPGAVSAWFTLHERFGRLPFAALFEPAIAYAANGFPVSPVVARFWRFAHRTYTQRLVGREFNAWFETFAPNGATPRPGDIARLPDHAETLRRIATSQGRSFYEGDIAEQIDAAACATGGLIRATDLAAHTAAWVDPIRASYRGFDVWEIPPNGQGITALMALNMLDGFGPDVLAQESSTSWHVQIEAIKLAFADAASYVADPEHADVPTNGLLDAAYAATRRALITDEASDPAPGHPPRGGTVYLCTADGDGNMVSFIQSNYQGFGSGIVVPGTGIALQNRGANFTLEAGHPNQVAPGKRPYHTIIPGFLTRDGEAVGPFGVMGGFMQPQGHVQVIVRTIDGALHPQAALDAPRWRCDEGRKVAVENRTPQAIIDDLIARGHDVRVESEPSAFGRGQIIWRNGATLIAGSESRADGQALAW
jgi:gamma-glutamyltranspeptidase / glutathione hydrolase